MSTVDSIDTPTDSRAGTQQPESTIPSSPMTELTIQENKPSSEGAASMEVETDEDHVNGATGESNVDVEDTAGMDTKAKALMHLLQTSSVSCRLCATIRFWQHSNLSVMIGFCCYHVRQNEEAARGGKKAGCQAATSCPRTQFESEGSTHLSTRDSE